MTRPRPRADLWRILWRVASLRSQSHATIWVKRRRMAVAVHELDGEAYDIAKQYALKRWPGIETHEVVSGRRIPSFRLAP